MGLRGLLTSQKSSSIPVVYDERDLEQLVQGVQLLRTFRTALVFVLHRMHEAIYSGLTANGGTELILIWKEKKKLAQMTMNWWWIFLWCTL